MRIIKNQSITRIGTIPVIIFAIAMLFSSCVTQRNLEYLRVKDMNDEVIKTYDDAKMPDYKLKPLDQLSIDIKSLDDPTTNVFQQSSNNQSYNVDPYSASLKAYLVDKSGFIQMPFIGNIYVEDKTIPEVISILQDSLNNILSSPTVTVRLVNRYVSVLGEVRNPGHFPYAQEKLTIYDALSAAGDITVYGDRDEVILARNENGKNLRISIDLTSSDIMASEYYYVQPNDMIYVKTMRKRFWGFSEFPWNILLGSITTGVLMYTVISK
ncbi:hypothetical protein MASR2M47_20690 [Draconibacterium sp.]|jgi:polysaccharide export outer membrane protein